MMTGVQAETVRCNQCGSGMASSLVIASSHRWTKECPACGWTWMRQPQTNDSNEWQFDESGHVLYEITETPGYGTWCRTTTDRTLSETGRFNADATLADKERMKRLIIEDPLYSPEFSYITHATGDNRSVVHVLGSRYQFQW